MNSRNRRILIADDHEVVRKGLRLLLASRPDWQVCGEAANGREAVEKTAQLEPDIVLMDASMPEMDGMEATRTILKAKPTQKIVIYTMHDSDTFTNQARKAGASGLIRKSDHANEVLKGIEAVLEGKPFFPSASN